MSQDPRPDVKIRPAIFPDDKETVSKLVLAYAEFLPVDLSFQNFEQELSGLPGKYAVENGGAVYLAYTTSIPSAEQTSTSNSSTSITPDVPQASSAPEEQAIGCIGIRPFRSSTYTSTTAPSCELKRLYLTPASRGLGVGKLLLEVAIQQARQLGYGEMLLDTLKSMTTARGLYERYGFVEIEKYYESVEGAAFYRLVL